MTDIAKILKDAPRGLKLYSLNRGEVTLNQVDTTQEDYPIGIIDKQDEISDTFTKDGKIYYEYEDAECILFPSKEHKSWDNWQEILFQYGDIIICEIVNIIKDQRNVCCIYNGYNKHYNDYAGYFYCHEGLTAKNLNKQILLKNARYATQEERKQFIAELNANGYKWNDDTKQIEKIKQQYTPKYKVGDWIKFNESLCEITNIEDARYELFYHSTKYKVKMFINEIDTNAVIATEQELIDAGIKEKPFTIDDFKPTQFVLVRDWNDEKWNLNIFSYINESGEFVCVSEIYDMCIPYNNETKHLLGTTDDCLDKYKTW